MKSGYIRVQRAKGGRFRFNVIAANGKVVATGQTYKTKAGVMKGIEATFDALIEVWAETPEDIRWPK